MENWANLAPPGGQTIFGWGQILKLATKVSLYTFTLNSKHGKYFGVCYWERKPFFTALSITSLLKGFFIWTGFLGLIVSFSFLSTPVLMHCGLLCIVITAVLQRTSFLGRSAVSTWLRDLKMIAKSQKCFHSPCPYNTLDPNIILHGDSRDNML